MDRLGISNVARQARFFDACVEQALLALFLGRCLIF